MVRLVFGCIHTGDGFEFAVVRPVTEVHGECPGAQLCVAGKHSDRDVAGLRSRGHTSDPGLHVVHGPRDVDNCQGARWSDRISYRARALVTTAGSDGTSDKTFPTPPATSGA